MLADVKVTQRTPRPRSGVPVCGISGALATHFAGAPTRQLAWREHLFCEGDPATHVYRIESGHMCIDRTMSDGRRQVLDFLDPGDIIGLGYLKIYTANAQALEPTQLRLLPLSRVQQLAQIDPSVSEALYLGLAQELAAVRELLFTVCQRSSVQRVAGFLLERSRKHAARGESADEFVLAMTRTDIADFLGLTIETVSRAFTQLRRASTITVERDVIVTVNDHNDLADVAAGRRQSQ